MLYIFSPQLTLKPKIASKLLITDIPQNGDVGTDNKAPKDKMA